MKEEIKKEEFEKDGILYEIKEFFIGDVIKVQVFDKKTGNPIPGFCNCESEIAGDIRSITGENPEEKLFEIAMEHFLVKDDEVEDYSDKDWKDYYDPYEWLKQ